MRRMARHRTWLAGTAIVALTLALLGWQFASGAAPTARRAPATTAGHGVQTAASSIVGALFSMNGSQLGSHFCTASVIRSSAGNLLMTAAHCVSAYQPSAPVGLAFVPAYDGTTPLGIWQVTRIFVDAAWAAAANPNDDVAFLQVAPATDGTRIQDVTGAADLLTGQPVTGVVRVIGYPNGAAQPIACENPIRPFGLGQLEFDCDNFTMGTSGSPLLSEASPGTRTMNVIGVIGGYQQGGLSADVSYAATLGQDAQALFQAAVAAN